MLNSLHVKNFAIIDEVWIDLKKGFNVLSGETGAGKSILIGSVLAALGGRFSKDMLGSRGDYSLVELEFESDNEEIKKLLSDNDLEVSDEIIISRRISESGRSVCRINGETVSASLLKSIAGKLIDVFGQHEHHSLLSKPSHRRIVDGFSEEIKKLLPEVADAYKEYDIAAGKYHDASVSGKMSERELDLLKYELQEIEATALKPGEDDILEERFRVLSSAEKLQNALSGALTKLCDGYGSAEVQLCDSIKALSKVTGIDGNIDDISNRLDILSAELSGIASELRDYEAELSESGMEFEEVSARLDIINRLKSKYGRRIEDILEYAENVAARIEKNDDYELYLENLLKEKNFKYEKLCELSEKLSELRKSTGLILADNISKAMKELNFEHAVFEVRIGRKDAPDELGFDEVEFYLSTNVGEAAKSILSCASGGELSRIMLAIKSVIADGGSINTLIFDEIDVGISGRTAQKVAEKIARLSRSSQIICITHLPQLAAMADMHFLIEKHNDGEKTSTDIHPLYDEDIIKELGRMLSGALVTSSVLENAREMKQLATDYKNNL